MESTYISLRTTRKDLHVCVVDTDWGIGVVKRNDFFDTKTCTES